MQASAAEEQRYSIQGMRFVHLPTRSGLPAGTHPPLSYRWRAVEDGVVVVSFVCYFERFSDKNLNLAHHRMAEGVDAVANGQRFLTGELQGEIAMIGKLWLILGKVGFSAFKHYIHGVAGGGKADGWQGGNTEEGA